MNTNCYVNVPYKKSEMGLGDDIPCIKCGKAELDTGLECTNCGCDNYEAITGKPYSSTKENNHEN